MAHRLSVVPSAFCVIHRKVLCKFVAALGAESVREDFIAARAAHASGTELSSVDNTPRALGGIFIRLCKTRTGESLAAVHTAKLTPRMAMQDKRLDQVSRHGATAITCSRKSHGPVTGTDSVSDAIVISSRL